MNMVVLRFSFDHLADPLFQPHPERGARTKFKLVGRGRRRSKSGGGAGVPQRPCERFPALVHGAGESLLTGESVDARWRCSCALLRVSNCVAPDCLLCGAHDGFAESRSADG